MELNKKSGSLIFCLAVILVFVVVQTACSAEDKTTKGIAESGSTEQNITDGKVNQANSHKIIVYYFHGKNRCYTCKRIEKLTRETVDNYFGNEISAGLVKMEVVNVDEPKNKHFAKEYQLFTKSVIVSDIVNGKEQQWKNLQKVWELVHNEEAFKEYIRNEIKLYLS
ncbi:MAG: hypothetical protein KKC46_04965 [Proteobacteria bacterium]|nr:hypothetical protein [Pseudomonadota bacterium]